MQTAAPTLEFPGFADEIQRIGQEAVQEAQDNLRAKGIPLCFSRNGRIYYEMPDGSIQTETRTRRCFGRGASGSRNRAGQAGTSPRRKAIAAW